MLPQDLQTSVLNCLVGSQGNFLFLAPVCKQWYKLVGYGTGSGTTLKQIMASPSTIRESGESPGGNETLSKNAWGFLAKHRNTFKPEMANELLLQKIQWDEFSVATAGNHGNLGFIYWLEKQDKLGWDPELALSSAALAGEYVFLKHMYKSGYNPERRSVQAAARAGAVQILEWMNKIGCDMTDANEALAEEGHLGPLKWAHSIGLFCDKISLDAALDAAAYGQKREVVLYLKHHVKEVNRTRR